MINLYNPFKPHVVLFDNGKFGVRKLEFWSGWVYFDQTSNRDEHWWHIEEYVVRYSQADSVNKLRRPFTAKYFKE